MPCMCSLLVQRCMNDGALLEAVCQAAQQAAASVTGCTVWMSFYSVLVSEVLTELPKVHFPLLQSEGLHSAPPVSNCTELSVLPRKAPFCGGCALPCVSPRESYEFLTLSILQQVDEKMVAQLLPFLLSGLKKQSHTEYQLATYMMLMRLITRCSPAPQLFNGAAL